MKLNIAEGFKTTENKDLEIKKQEDNQNNDGSEHEEYSDQDEGKLETLTPHT